MKTFRNVPLYSDTYARLKAYAGQRNRSPHGQIMEWLNEAERAEHIEYLPHPEDAEPIPVIQMPKPTWEACKCPAPWTIEIRRAGWPAGRYCIICNGLVGGAEVDVTA